MLSNFPPNINTDGSDGYTDGSSDSDLRLLLNALIKRQYKPKLDHVMTIKQPLLIMVSVNEYDNLRPLYVDDDM